MKKIRNFLFPPFIARYIDPEQCCGAVGDRTAQLLDALRRGIERRRCGQDHRPGLGQRRHVAQVYERQGRFAYDEHQPAPLLEHHVGGPLDQALRRAGGHTPHGTYRRRHDRHAVVTRRAARRRGEHVVVRILTDASVYGQRHPLVRHHLAGVAAAHERDLRHARRGEQPFYRQAGIDGAAGGGYGDYEPHVRIRWLCI